MFSSGIFLLQVIYGNAIQEMEQREFILEEM